MNPMNSSGPHSSAFAARVTDRHARYVEVARSEPGDSSPDDFEVMAIEPTTVVAIIVAVIAACDALNPGWRDWAKGLLDRLNPWSRSREEKLRNRARAAKHPEAVGMLGRNQARRDRAMVLSRAREQLADVPPLYPSAPALYRSAEWLADAILDEVIRSTDAEIRGVTEELARS